MVTLINIVAFFTITLITVGLLFHLFGKKDMSWTQKDIDDGDKMYGFMCCTCEKPLEDGEGVPRLCDECNEYERFKLMHDDLKNIAKKHNVVVVTATQPKRDSQIGFEGNTTGNNILIIDYVSLLKNRT